MDETLYIVHEQHHLQGVSFLISLSQVCKITCLVATRNTQVAGVVRPKVERESVQSCGEKIQPATKE